MKIFYNKFLIISSLVLLIGGVYLYFSNDLNSETVMPIAYGSSLESTTGENSAPLSLAGDDKISFDTAFLLTLGSLKSINIDTTIFESESFKILQNNAVEIQPVAPGRINPFAPVSAFSTNNVTIGPNVVTDQVTMITDRTAVLNGTINTTNGVTNSHFQYGTTMALGTLTPNVDPSLVGTFVKNVFGLTPKTNYFVRACAKINNILLCGDVVPFTTN